MLDSINNYQIIQDDDPGHLMIFGYELNLDQTQLPTDRNVSIFTFRTILKNHLPFHQDLQNGKNLFLLTSQLSTTNNTTIDLSGFPGRDYIGGPKVIPGAETCYSGGNAKAPSGDNVDALGVHEDGPGGKMNGLNAGNLYLNVISATTPININASGANGGKGQPGTDGLPGCSSLITGYPGMDGGDGTLGGYGGNGGVLKIAFDNNLDHKTPAFDISTIICNINNGLQGDSGIGGNFGKGGPGIRPRIPVDPRHPTAEPPNVPFVRVTSGANGIHGISAPNTHIRDGKKGVLQGVTAADKVDFFKYISIDFVKLLMLKAESLYLNSNFAEAHDVLLFIFNISSSNPDKGFFDVANQQEINDYLFYLKDYSAFGNNTSGWAYLMKKSVSYLNQIYCNQDIFGYPYNYAPNLTVDYLTTHYVQLYQLIPAFIANVENIDKENTKLTLAQIQNDANKTQCTNLISQLNRDIKPFATDIDSLGAEIRQRLVVIESLKAILLSDDAAFKSAVEAQSGCSFGTLVHFVTAIVAVVATIYTLGAASELAVAAVGSVVEDVDAAESLADVASIIKGVQDVSKQMGTIEQSLASLKKEYNGLYALVQPQPPDTLIGVNKANFDKTIDQYLDLPEAQRYKADYHQFVDYVDLTNQKRKQITNDYLAINAIYQNIQNLESQLNKFAVQGLEDAPMKTSDKIALYDLYYQTKWLVIKQVYLQNKALLYQFPKTNNQPMVFNDISLDALNVDTYENAATSLVDLNEGSFLRISNTRPLRVQFADYPHRFTNFKNTLVSTDNDQGEYFTFEFNIAPPVIAPGDVADHPLLTALQGIFPGNKTNIKVMGLLANLNDDTPAGRSLTIRLTHLGNSLVTTTSNFQGQLAFSHKTKLVSLPVTFNNAAAPVFTEDEKINLVGGTLGGSESTSLGVSPFASWKIEIYLNENPGLTESNAKQMISELTSIDLYFWYYFQNP